MTYVNCGTVCCVLLHADRHLVLIRRGNPHEYGYGELALPGGFQEGGIAEPVRFAAAREVQEELGLTIDPEKLKLINIETDDFRHNVIFWEYAFPSVDDLRAAALSGKHDPDEVLEVLVIDAPVETCFSFHTTEVNNFFDRYPVTKLGRSSFIPQPDENIPDCYTCAKAMPRDGFIPWTMSMMFLCPTCGNKRCPKATDHRLACTGSNEPGQEGSRY